ncbi:hypothetical protein, partial [Acinetobacter baumannii]|uniref:hypothetical protein n=1 Tax=Acinetobacter baumannii TaxID=470 RepID=UPI001EEF6456
KRRLYYCERCVVGWELCKREWKRGLSFYFCIGVFLILIYKKKKVFKKNFAITAIMLNGLSDSTFSVNLL